MTDRAERVRELLVGPRPLGLLLAVTPIPAIFTALVHAGWTESTDDAWWRRATSGPVDAVLVPQGSAVADLGLAAGAVTRMELLGYAGSLSPTIDVGDIAKPAAARLFGGVAHHRLAGDPDGMMIVTSSHLLAAYDAMGTEVAGASLVDMETAHLAAAVEGVGGPMIGVRVLVTDRIPDLPFYRLPSGAATVLRERRQQLIEEFLDELTRAGLL